MTRDTSDANDPESTSSDTADEPDGQNETAVLPEFDTEVLPRGMAAAPVAASASPSVTPETDDLATEPVPRRRLSRAAKGWIIAGVAVVVIGVLAVVGDIVARANAEQSIAQQIEDGFPENVEGDVAVQIAGFSVIAQYLTGTMDHLDIDAPELTVNGAPISVFVDADGVPVDRSKPVSTVDAEIVASQASINQLIDLPDIDGELTLNDGLIGFEGAIEILGFDVSYGVSAKPEAAGDTVLLTPVSVQVGGGDGIDLGGLANTLLGDQQISVCAAEYLPEGMQVTDAVIEEQSLRLSLAATDLVLGDDALEQRGSC